MILICLLYTCGVWIESVDPVADLRLTNQVLYGTILPSTAEYLITYAIPLLVLVHEDPQTTFFCTPHDAGVAKDARFSIN